MSETVGHGFVSSCVESEEVYLGVCCEIFLTRKHNLSFHCSLCHISKHASFPGLIEHFSRTHNLSIVSSVGNETSSNDVEIKCEVEDIGNFDFVEIFGAVSNEFKREANGDFTAPLTPFEELKGPYPEQSLEDFQTDQSAENPEIENQRTQADTSFTKDIATRPVSTQIRKTKKRQISSIPKSNIAQRHQKKCTAYKCDKCDGAFSSQRNLRVHVASHKRVKKETIYAEAFVVKCDKCDREFTNKRSLQNHASTHNERNHSCGICGAAFKDMNTLKQHRARHLGVKKYACPECPKMFYFPNELKSHHRRHTGERPYICDTCGASYFLHSELTEHMKRHTKTRRYQCKMCNLSFYNSSLLKDHLVVHAEERNHVCDICNSSFKRRRALILHMKIHQNKREYVCPFCDKGFNQNPGLNSHLKIVHKIESTPGAILSAKMCTSDIST